MNGRENTFSRARPQTRRGYQAASLGAQHARGVRFVHNQLGSILARERDQVGDGCAIAIHAEEALYDNKFPGTASAMFPKLCFENIEVQVGKDHFARARKSQAVNNAGVIGAV